MTHRILERMKMEVVRALKSDIPAILEIWKELMDFHVRLIRDILCPMMQKKAWVRIWND